MSEHKRSKSGGNQPISRHPLFPAIVALWFGALFGAGSIAIPPSLIERVVTAFGIDHVLPMAAPPLGATARILMALVMTGLGVAAGVVAARRLTARDTQVHHRRRNVSPATEEESTQEQATRDRTTPDKAPAGRLRAFAAKPRTAVENDAPVAREPAAAQDKRILNVAEFGLDGFEDISDAEDVPAAVAPGLHLQAETFAGDEEPAAFAPPVEVSPGNLFETYSRGIAARTEDTPPPFTASEASSGPDFEILPHASEEADSADAAGYDEDDATALPIVDAGHEEPATSSEGRKAAERIAAARLDELSPIELLERLALAMAQRRESAQRAAVALVQLPVLVADESVAEPEIEAEAEAAAIEVQACEPPLSESPSEFQPSEPQTLEPVSSEPLPFAQPRFQATPDEAAEELAVGAALVQDPEPDVALPHIPAALRPVSFGDLPDDDEDVLPAYIPPRHIGLAQAADHAGANGAASLVPPSAEEEEEDMDEEEELVLDQGYSSLLDLSRPLVSRENPTQQFIGNEESGTDGDDGSLAIFPGEESRDTGPFGYPAPDAPDAIPTGTPQIPRQAAPQSDRLFDAPGKTGPRETEEALRSALAALQRMSGAA
ncbi:hypothetical protein [Novosphingobium naphthalenivorans]|uniref:hypothetical protein n=1 Tax=Novosphingobium naphthalenivorans TaxID=273168 RepID=UPI000829F0B6|nr:hypothetical protein [Novosphingobium naphthalenivorans]